MDNRTTSIRQQCRETDAAATDVSEWWYSNICLHFLSVRSIDENFL
jgi:hypothetical protein